MLHILNSSSAFFSHSKEFTKLFCYLLNCTTKSLITIAAISPDSPSANVVWKSACLVLKKSDRCRLTAAFFTCLFRRAFSATTTTSGGYFTNFAWLWWLFFRKWMMLYDINFKDQWCVDLDHMHMSGISNGGMLLWNIAAQVPDGFGKFWNKSKLNCTNSRFCNLFGY